MPRSRSIVVLFLVSAVVSSLTVLSRVSAAELTTSQIAEKALPATVLVEIPGEGIGSGVVISSDGVVLSCYHVVDKAKSALVKMPNGGYFPAQGLLGFNPALDIAVLKIEGKDLPSLPTGDSALLKPGDKVVAVGSPKGLENTVSEGVVSAVRRIGELPDDYRKYMLDAGRTENDTLIQFTAPISPGSSGGPLINSAGEVVGVVILGDTRQNVHDIYFAVPVNEAKLLLTSRTVMKFSEIDFTAVGGNRKRIGVGAADLGLGTAAEKTEFFIVPHTAEPTYRVQPGLSPNPDTIHVMAVDERKQFTSSSGSPGQAEFKVLADGSLLFSPADRNTRLSVSFKARPKRVAVLPIVNTSDIDYMATATRSAVATALNKYSFEVCSEAEVGAIVRQEQMNLDAVLLGVRDVLSVDNITKLADKLNAAHVVFAAVGTGDEYTRSDTSAAVTLLMFDGRTGKVVLTKQQTISKKSLFSHRATRERIVRDSVDAMLGEYYGLRK